MAQASRTRRWASRVAWLALIWTASAATLLVVALLIRLVMRSIGMSS